VIVFAARALAAYILQSDNQRRRHAAVDIASSHVYIHDVGLCARASVASSEHAADSDGAYQERDEDERERHADDNRRKRRHPPRHRGERARPPEEEDPCTAASAPRTESRAPYAPTQKNGPATIEPLRRGSGGGCPRHFSMSGPYSRLSQMLIAAPAVVPMPTPTKMRPESPGVNAGRTGGPQMIGNALRARGQL
jgi:hypothetical protein